MKKLLTLLALSTSIATATAQTQVTFFTNKGTFKALLYDAYMPITTTNFKNLVQSKFYDNVIFNRVINNFVVQAGYQYADNTFTPTIPNIMDEFSTNTSNVQKSLGMANAGPNTGSSEFYINLKNNTYLDPNYPVFGIVTDNFAVIQTMGTVITNIDDQPQENQIIDSARITTDYVSIQETNSSRLRAEIYPMPVTPTSYLYLETISNQAIELSIHDLQGTLISTTISKNKQLLMNDLQINNLAKGIYILTINDGQNKAFKRIILD